MGGRRWPPCLMRGGREPRRPVPRGDAGGPGHLHGIPHSRRSAMGSEPRAVPFAAPMMAAPSPWPGGVACRLSHRRRVRLSCGLHQELGPAPNANLPSGQGGGPRKGDAAAPATKREAPPRLSGPCRNGGPTMLDAATAAPDLHLLLAPGTRPNSSHCADGAAELDGPRPLGFMSCCTGGMANGPMPIAWCRTAGGASRHLPRARGAG